MKKLILLLVSLIGISAFAKIDRNKSSFKLVIDRNTTESDLAKLIEGAKMVNVNLSINEKNYNDQGKLSRISGKVEMPNGGSGTFGSDNLGKIIISQDLNSNDSGFSIVVKNKII